MDISTANTLATHLTATTVHTWRIQFARIAHMPCPCGGVCVREARFVITDGHQVITSAEETAQDMAA